MTSENGIACVRCGPVISGIVSALHSVVTGLISGGRSRYTLLIRPNELEATVQWFHMSHALLAGYSGHGNSIHNL